MFPRLIILLAVACLAGSLTPALADDGAARAQALVDDVLAYLGFADTHREDLRQGKVIYTGMPDLEVAPNELAVAGAVLVVRKPLSEVTGPYLRGESFRYDPAILDFERLLVDDDAELARAFDEVAFVVDERAEVDRLLKVKPGATFNLSSDEMRLFRSIDPKGPTAYRQVMTTLRNLLRERFDAYRAGGASTIASYARKGDAETLPGRELIRAIESATLVKRHYPEFHEVILGYPQEASVVTEDRFFWIKREVEKRSCFILAHQLIDVRDDIALGAELHFYVGHTYDSQLTLIGAAPFESGTLVFGATRIFTDKVTGFGGSLKKTFGRKIVARKIADRFERLRTRLEQ